MSRRQRRERLSVFEGFTASCFHHSINELGERIEAIHSVGFTHDEYLALTAPKEHWETLKEVGKIAQVDKTVTQHQVSFTYNGRKTPIVFTIKVVDGNTPLRPRADVIRNDAPPELVAKLHKWIEGTIEAKLNTSRTWTVFEWLNTNCANKGQMRYLWPSILAIAALNTNTMEATNKMRDAPAPKTLPRLPPEVREACKTTAAFVAAAGLLDEAIPPMDNPVEVAVASQGLGISVDAGALGVLDI